VKVSLFRHRGKSAPAQPVRPARARLYSAVVESLEGRMYYASIAGRVYDDTSGNGTGSDPGHAGTAVQLWDQDLGTGGPATELQETTTAADGTYLFSDVPVYPPLSCHTLSVKIIQDAGLADHLVRRRLPAV
jgi:hypothetical protein